MRPIIATYAWLLTRLPEAFARWNCALLGEIVWRLRGGLIRRNLARAFPAQDAAWVRRVGRVSCRRTAEMGLFSIASPLMADAELRSRVAVDDSLLDGVHGIPLSGTGGVLFVPHFALMEMMAHVALVRPEMSQRDWVVIYRPLNQPAAEKWVKDGRERHGLKLVSRREGFHPLMKAVRGGHLAVVLFDQTIQSGTVWRFLGAPCAVTELPGIIAQRFRCPARLFWVERTGFWRGRLHSLALQSTDAIGLTVESNAWLETRLRSGEDACANWLWAHDRWKHADAPALKVAD